LIFKGDEFVDLGLVFTGFAKWIDMPPEIFRSCNIIRMPQIGSEFGGTNEGKPPRATKL
jgi:hypothetical protein